MDPLYAALSHDNALGWVQGQEGGEPRPLDSDPVLEAVRQIAYEVDRSMRESAVVARALGEHDVASAGG